MWAEAIGGVRKKNRSQQLKDIEQLRTSYEEQFNWEKQCDILVDKMWDKVHGAGMLYYFPAHGSANKERSHSFERSSYHKKTKSEYLIG